jgi:DNA polymerase-1
MAMNAPIQGTQADIIKLAMIEADRVIEKNKWREKVKLVMQVHDELVYELDEKISEDAALEIKKVMETVVSPSKLSGVPIIAEAKIGRHWGEMRRL